MLLVLRPPPMECITQNCVTEEQVIESGRDGESYALVAAAKFRDGAGRQGLALFSDATRVLLPVIAWVIGAAIA